MANNLPPIPTLPVSEVFPWRQWFTTLQQNVTTLQATSGGSAIVPTYSSNILLGRYSPGTGPAQQITIGTNLTLSSTGVLSATSGSSGTGTVTSVSVTTSNGFAGTVSTPTTTPGIIISTTVTGLLKGNGTAISSAIAGTDYYAIGGALGTPSSGTLTNCTGYTYANLGGTIPTWNQNTTGTASTITGVYSGTITSSQITTGLGFTPYNATNPSSYIALSSAITGYTVGSNTALVATDTLNAALGKLQGQVSARGTGTVTSITAGTGLSGGTITTTGTVAIANTAVTAASYTSANITVNAQGQITSASNGLTTFINVLSYGATGNGTTDDTTAIQNAINVANSSSTGGTVFFPPGTYKLTTQLTVNGQGVTLMGSGRQTTLYQTNLTSNILTVTNTKNTVHALSFTYSGTPTAGSALCLNTGSAINVYDVFLTNVYIGIELVNSIDIKITQFNISNIVAIGVYCHSTGTSTTNDAYFSQFVIYGGTGGGYTASLGCIRLYNMTEAMVFTDGDVITGTYSLTTDATTYTRGSCPAFNKFTGVYFDSASNTSALLNNIIETEFVNCWFGYSSGGGAVLQATNGLKFTGGGAIDCVLDGVTVASTSVSTTFVNFGSKGNSRTTANTYSGINIAANTSDFIISNCSIGNTFGSIFSIGTQKYGVLVNVGTSNRYVITNNLISGNGTAGVLDGGTGVSKNVSNNF